EKLEQFVLLDHRLIDGYLHGHNSTLNVIAVKTIFSPRPEELVRDVERAHHRHALDVVALRGVADLAHLRVEIGDGGEQLGLLLGPARDLVFAAHDLHGKLRRVVHFASPGSRASRASSRSVASLTCACSWRCLRSAARSCWRRR